MVTYPDMGGCRSRDRFHQFGFARTGAAKERRCAAGQTMLIDGKRSTFGNISDRPVRFQQSAVVVERAGVC